jgi:hypothetical protein
MARRPHEHLCPLCYRKEAAVTHGWYRCTAKSCVKATQSLCDRHRAELVGMVAEVLRKTDVAPQG